MTIRSATTKRILTDMAGWGCIIGSGLIGWLPGPGGIPLLLTGLGLLSIHNKWAKSLLHYFNTHSQNIRVILFPNKPVVKLLWDFTVFGLLTAVYVLYTKLDGPVAIGLSISVSVVASTIFLMNRNRVGWLDRKRRRS